MPLRYSLPQRYQQIRISHLGTRHSRLLILIGVGIQIQEHILQTCPTYSNLRKYPPDLSNLLKPQNISSRPVQPTQTSEHIIQTCTPYSNLRSYSADLSNLIKPQSISSRPALPTQTSEHRPAQPTQTSE